MADSTTTKIIELKNNNISSSDPNDTTAVVTAAVAGNNINYQSSKNGGRNGGGTGGRGGDEEDLQKFTHWVDGEEPSMHDDEDDSSNNVNHGGWSVEDMFKTNQNLGVQSSFKDDLTQYTTVMPDGTKEDRARASKIAREIEHSEKSKRMAFLENDDEERDLDKETFVPVEGGGSGDGQHHRRSNRGGQQQQRGKIFNNQNQQKKEIPIVENHRANALRDPAPPQRNRPSDHGRQKDRGSSNFVKTPTTTTTFQSGQNINTGSNNESSQHQTRSNQQEQGVAASGGDKQITSNQPSNQKLQTFTRQKEALKNWGTNFTIEYRQNSSQSNNDGGDEASSPPQEITTNPSPSIPKQSPQPHIQGDPSQRNPNSQQKSATTAAAASIYPPCPTNAWKKGPPDFSSLQQPQQLPQQLLQQPQAYSGLQFTQPPPQQTHDLSAQLPNQQQQQQSTTPSPASQIPEFIPASAPPPTQEVSQIVGNPIEQQQQHSQPSEAESENSLDKKFQFNPDAPSFTPRNISTPNASSSPMAMTPVVTPHQQQQQQQHYILGAATQPHIPQSYIPQPVTSTMQQQQGYIFTTQGIQPNPNIFQQHHHQQQQQPYIQQPQIAYLPTTGIPYYNPQIITSIQGGVGGYPQQFIQQQQPGGIPQQQPIIVRSITDIPTSYMQQQQAGIQQQPQIQYQIPQGGFYLQGGGGGQQFQLQQQQPQQQLPLQLHQQQQHPAQLPYNTQPPPNGIRRYGQN